MTAGMLPDRVALVTGGTKGIGREVSLELARAGIAVATTFSRDEVAAEEMRQALAELGKNNLVFRADASNMDDMQRLTANLKDKFNAVHVLINNAGIARDKMFLQTSAKDWREILEADLTSSLIASRLVLPFMLLQHFGRIVNIGSVAALRGSPGQSIYATAKAGLIGLTKSLAREYGPRGITVNCVTPGLIDTDMTRSMDQKILKGLVSATPVGRIGTVQDVARLVAFLISDDAGYITGQVISVDGGLAV